MAKLAGPTAIDPSKYKSDKKITDEEVLKILEQPLAKATTAKKTKKKKKKPAKKVEGDDDDSDEDQDFFAGGEKSGLAVQNPGSSNPRDQINSILDRARRYVKRCYIWRK